MWLLHSPTLNFVSFFSWNIKFIWFQFFFPKISGELLVDSQQLLLVTVASVLLEFGYTIQVMHLQFFLHQYFWKVIWTSVDGDNLGGLRGCGDVTWLVWSEAYSRSSKSAMHRDSCLISASVTFILKFAPFVWEWSLTGQATMCLGFIPIISDMTMFVLSCEIVLNDLQLSETEVHYTLLFTLDWDMRMPIIPPFN